MKRKLAAVTLYQKGGESRPDERMHCDIPDLESGRINSLDPDGAKALAVIEAMEPGIPIGHAWTESAGGTLIHDPKPGMLAYWRYCRPDLVMIAPMRVIFIDDIWQTWH
ncbi:MAG: hypothetical protein KGI59_01285 [Patescibacteria group bacterium]|nr:hypothetical protein [Patescibacteria group bacterium]MDE2172718.1 hypothetical protein [Patescibacteria group bacterium]